MFCLHVGMFLFLLLSLLSELAASQQANWLQFFKVNTATHLSNYTDNSCISLEYLSLKQLVSSKEILLSHKNFYPPSRKFLEAIIFIGFAANVYLTNLKDDSALTYLRKNLTLV